MVRLKLQNPIAQALALGVGLFVVSLALRVLSIAVTGDIGRGPTAPFGAEGEKSFVVMIFAGLMWGVLLPATVETPFVTFVMRRVDPAETPVAFWIALVVITSVSWLMHGASFGSLGQGLAFALLAVASWGWSKRLGRGAYGLAILSHAVWNGIVMVLHIARHMPSST